MGGTVIHHQGDPVVFGKQSVLAGRLLRGEKGVTEVLGKGKRHERGIGMPFAMSRQDTIRLGRDQLPDSVH
jgi:hypothetical protein